MIKNATLRQLKVFEAVARNLSYTRAAEELFTTQPTVSIQLRQLTDIVGQPLLEQVGKRVFLTDTGRELLKVCREIFDGLERFEMLVSDMKGVKAGKLRLAVITTAKYFVPRLLGAPSSPNIFWVSDGISFRSVQILIPRMKGLFSTALPPAMILTCGSSNRRSSTRSFRAWGAGNWLLKESATAATSNSSASRGISLSGRSSSRKWLKQPSC